MRRTAIRFDDKHLEQLFSFAEKENLIDAGQGEIVKKFIERHNGFEEKPQIPQQPNQIKQINYIEWAEEHSCEHRVVDYEKPSQWKCAGKKIARSICKQRQERFLHFGKNCFPQHLAHHCKMCGREIRPQYTYCYSCNDKRQERKMENYTPQGTVIFRG